LITLLATPGCGVTDKAKLAVPVPAASPLGKLTAQLSNWPLATVPLSTEQLTPLGVTVPPDSCSAVEGQIGRQLFEHVQRGATDVRPGIADREAVAACHAHRLAARIGFAQTQVGYAGHGHRRALGTALGGVSVPVQLSGLKVLGSGEAELDRSTLARLLTDWPNAPDKGVTLSKAVMLLPAGNGPAERVTTQSSNRPVARVPGLAFGVHDAVPPRLARWRC
jgi:hypothetical protein